MKIRKLRMAGREFSSLQNHLFPGDGLEAVAFALCGHLETDEEEIFTVHSLLLYPHDKCTVRAGDRVEWSPAEIVDLFESCRKKGFRLLKIHSHPEYWPFFSQVDDKSDIDLSETFTGWTGRNENICSVVMLPGGGMIGRMIDHEGNFIPLHSILVISENISCFHDLSEGSKKVQSANEDDVQLRTTLEQLKEADLARTDPEEHKRQLKEGYIKSANVDSPAVISINMMFSSQAVTELLARLHPFRDRRNENYAAISFSVSGFLLIPEREGKIDEELTSRVGLGHRKPALDSPMLIIRSNISA